MYYDYLNLIKDEDKKAKKKTTQKIKTFKYKGKEYRKAEYDRLMEIKALYMAGKIKSLRISPHITLIPALYEYSNGKKNEYYNPLFIEPLCVYQPIDSDYRFAELYFYRHKDRTQQIAPYLERLMYWLYNIKLRVFVVRESGIEEFIGDKKWQQVN